MVQHGLDVRGDVIRFLTALVAVLAIGVTTSRPPAQRRPGATVGAGAAARAGVPVRLSVAHSLAARSPRDWRRRTILDPITLWLPARLERLLRVTACY